jgi:hypothetical protein
MQTNQQRDMKNPNMDELLSEVKKLRLQNHRWQQVACLLLVVAFVALTLGAETVAKGIASFSRVEAKTVIITDAAGKDRIRMTSATDQGPMIEMLTPTGEVQLQLSAKAEQSLISLNDPKGQPRLLITSEKTGSGVQIRNPKGKRSAEIAMDKSGLAARTVRLH